MMCSIVVLIALMTACAVDAPQRPNVLFILVDDLGYHDLSFTGSEYYETPHIDRLASTSHVFTQGYAASRVCSPSRASIMTGCFTATHGITEWIGAKSGTEWHEQRPYTRAYPSDYESQLDTARYTLAEAMRDQGYHTFFAGKWHLGGEGSAPEDHGFDINIGGYHSGSPKGGYFAPFINPAIKEDVAPGTNLSAYLARATADFIKEKRESPFFAMLSFYAVHGPIQTNREKWEKYKNKALMQGVAEEGFGMEKRLPIRLYQDNPVYAGLVEHMDGAVGIVLETLDSLGLMDNTVIVFTSDNGGVASGDAYSTSNAPLRGGKGYQWEGGVREPYFIKMPGQQELITIDYPVSGVDFYPTLMEAVNAPMIDEEVDGISLLPLMAGDTLPERPLYWHYPHYSNQGGDPAAMVRLGDYKLIHYWETDAAQLYHLGNDPQEVVDLSDSLPEKTRELDELLLGWLSARDAKYPELVEGFDLGLEKADAIKKETVLKPKLEKRRKNMLRDDYQPNEDWWESEVTRD
ncbi:sulfatase [Marinoscillum furvescens]|nr:sulfatase [Marinoscillum furvescens]